MRPDEGARRRHQAAARAVGHDRSTGREPEGHEGRGANGTVISFVSTNETAVVVVCVNGDFPSSTVDVQQRA